MAEVYVGLGSNIGDKAGNLRAALKRLAGAGGSEVSLLTVSSLYRTEPVGYLDQDWFLNAAALVETELSPHELLHRMIAIERELGRVRTVSNGPRTIDLDILLWEDRIVNEDDLVIPHPRLQDRLFVLEPLSEIAPGLRHPVLGLTILECRAKLAAQTQGETGVLRIEAPTWVGSLDS